MSDFLSLNGHVYTVTPLLVDVGLPTFVKVGKMLGPGFARLFDSNFRKQDVGGEEVSTLIADLFTRMDDPALMPVVTTLMDSVLEDDKPMTVRWKTEFSFKLATLSKILFFAIQKHFGDFMIGSASPVKSSDGSTTDKTEPNSKKATKSG